jgi:C-terminal processing protease CtpA/Prc
MMQFCKVLLGCLMFCGLLSLSWAGDEGFGGVGLQVVPTINGDLVVLNVLQDTPAANKGLLPGDLIFQVDDFPLQGSDFGKVVSEHLWGPVGSTVELHYRRPGVTGVRQVVLTRTAIDPRMTVTPTVKDSTPAQHGRK